MVDLDKLLETINTVKSHQHGDFENVILVKSIGNHGFLKVGELFGLPVYATDALPKHTTLMVAAKRDVERNGAKL